MKEWEYERLFNEDIREKKKAGRGSFHKRGKGVKHGFSGALKTPYHYMSNKEKKKLNGEVEVYQMYETIIPMDEFKLKDEETQKLLLTKWREIYSNTEIKKGLGIANSPYYKLVETLNVPRKQRGGPRDTRPKHKRKATAAAISPQMNMLEFESTEIALKPEIKKETVKQMLITRGLHLEYNGEYDVDALSKLFTKLQLLLDSETNKYNISLSLSEICED